MKKLFSILFVTTETAMLFLVAFTFIYLHMQQSDSYPDFRWGQVDYPVSQSYTDYREEVKDTLDLSFTDEDRKAAETLEAVSEKSSILASVSKLIHGLETKIEDYTNAQKILGNRKIVEAKKNLDKIMGLDMTASLTAGRNSDTDVRDVIGPTDEGQLGWIQDNLDITERLENMVAFCLKKKAEGKNVVIFENPNKYIQTAGFRDYSEEKYDQIHNMADAYGLDLMQVGAILKAEGMTEKDIFYDTDFHWKASTGLLADRILCEHLNEQYGYSIDTGIFDRDRYNVETQVDGFLGYMGKKVTLSYTEPDDFEIWTPAYDTDLTVWNSLFEEEQTGSMYDTMFWHDRLDLESLYDGNKYEFYGYSDQALIRVHNNQFHDGKHLLLIKTSFANCMSPYLTQAAEYVDILDTRAFTGCVETLLQDLDPDTIVLVVGLSSYEDDTVVGGQFDFR